MITEQKTKTLDYTVILYSEAIDPEDGTQSERTPSIRWDEGITQDWDKWLSNFNEIEGEPYCLFLIIPIDPNFEGEF